jgi:hypothetical protein
MRSTFLPDACSLFYGLAKKRQVQDCLPRPEATKATCSEDCLLACLSVSGVEGSKEIWICGCGNGRGV